MMEHEEMACIFADGGADALGGHGFGGSGFVGR